MTPLPCGAWAERRSAFVDEALSAADRDRLLNHLAGCDACRADLVDLRAVRQIVAGTTQSVEATPTDLASRLTSIGAQPTGPAGRAGSPAPRSRRSGSRWRQAYAVMAGAGAAVVLTGVAGYVSAPPPPPAVSDPAAEAQAEFSAAVAPSAVGRSAISTVMMADPGQLAAAAAPMAASGPDFRPAPAQGAGITAREALGLLRQAPGAGQALDFRGEQTLLVFGASRTLAAKLDVVAQAGRGRQTDVVGADGRTVLTGFTPAGVPSRVSDGQLWSLLERNYTLGGAQGSAVAGRPATMVEASRGSVVRSRWWIDDQTGLVLWQDSFAANGRPLASVGFVSVVVGPRAGLADLTATGSQRTASLTTTTTLTLASTGRLGRQGWFTDSTLAGLTLVRVRTDSADDPQTLTLVYTDGLNAVTVHQGRGRLGDPPPGTHWDPAFGAHVELRAAATATWQSGSTVYTVVTDGSTQLLSDAVRGLPHDPVRERTRMELIQAGWAEILADLRG